MHRDFKLPIPIFASLRAELALLTLRRFVPQS